RRYALIRDLARIPRPTHRTAKPVRHQEDRLQILRAAGTLVAAGQGEAQRAVVAHAGVVGEAAAAAGREEPKQAVPAAGGVVVGVGDVLAGEGGVRGSGTGGDGGGDGGLGEGAVGVERAARLLGKGLAGAVIGGETADPIAGGGGGAVAGVT
ncbi:MAG: hypothetical protein LQ346_009030, partial [Caloplaca aetnensis]